MKTAALPPSPQPSPVGEGALFGAVDSRERGTRGCCRWGVIGKEPSAGHTMAWIGSFSSPWGEKVPAGGDEGATRANHEPFSPNKTSIAGARMGADWIFGLGGLAAHWGGVC
jgi:hypothetical protein